MSNIISYFNTFLNVLFGSSLTLYSPAVLISVWSSAVTAGIDASSFEVFFLSVIQSPSFVFSCFVWVFFAILTVNLLLIFPYHWIRSVIRKCSGR